MADVKKYIEQIANAKKGKDVRASIIAAINEVSDENNEYNAAKEAINVDRTAIEQAVEENKQTERKFASEVAEAKNIQSDLKQNLDTSIASGIENKTALDETIEEAKNINAVLDTNNQKATSAEKTRQEAETKRIAAEEQRAQEMQLAIINVNKATEAAKKASENIQKQATELKKAKISYKVIKKIQISADTEIACTAIAINTTELSTTQLGETKQLTATVTPSNTTDTIS